MIVYYWPPFPFPGDVGVFNGKDGTGLSLAGTTKMGNRVSSVCRKNRVSSVCRKDQTYSSMHV